LKSLLNRQISFSIFSETDHSSKHFSVSQFFFLLTVLSICAVACLTGLIAFRCSFLHKTLPSKTLLEETKLSQQSRISAQTEQINLLNQKLGELNEKFTKLQGMKSEICKIGRIEQPVNQENLFGVGGSRGETVGKGSDTGLTGRTDDSVNADPPSDKNRQNDTDFDPAAPNGRKLVLNRSDFYINPIACIPSSLPLNGAIQKEQEAGQIIARSNDSPQGILLKTVEGNEIMAPANGIITFVNNENDAGETVIIDHGHGYVTRYACLQNVTKKLGSLVLKGEVIGQAQAGSSEVPPHFFYEIMLNGLPVNPEKYINQDPFLL
jgi:hypothetical protein